MTNILISQLGVADPIQNNHDGAMLHIYRHYPIDKVILIDTGAMPHLGKDDYLKALNSVRKIDEANVDYLDQRHLKFYDYEEVQDFFMNLLINIMNTNSSEKTEVFLNLSSATGAMTAVTYSIGQIYPNAKIIQSRYDRRKQENQRQNMPSIDELIASNEDNDPGSKNRGVEVPKNNLLTPLMNYYIGHGAIRTPIVICEGKSDKIYLKKIFQANGISEDDVFIVSEGGCSAAVRNYEAFSRFSDKVYCVLDGDARGNQTEYAKIQNVIPTDNLITLKKKVIEQYNTKIPEDYINLLLKTGPGNAKSTGEKTRTSSKTKVKHAREATINDLRSLEAELMPLIKKLKG